MTILDFFSCQDLRRKTAKEYAGRCPVCGGNDRFCIWPAEGMGGRYHCRQCGITGDAIDFAVKYRGFGKRLALDMFGAATAPSFSAMRSNFHRQIRHTPKKSAVMTQPPPNPVWRRKAAEFFLNCDKCTNSETARSMLARRGLTRETARMCGIAVNMEYISQPRKEWGLDGYGQLSLPPGIVITNRRGGEIIGITIRKNSNDKYRYHEIAGSWQGCFILGKSGSQCVIMESALDACLLWQETKQRLTCVATFGASKPIDATTSAFIAKSPRIILCPDSDEGGKTALQNWQTLFPASEVLMPLAKDIGEMPRDSIRSWIAEALHPNTQTEERKPNLCHSGQDYGYKMNLFKVFADFYGISVSVEDNNEIVMRGNPDKQKQLRKWISTNRRYVIDRILEYQDDALRNPQDRGNRP